MEYFRGTKGARTIKYYIMNTYNIYIYIISILCANLTGAMSRSPMSPVLSNQQECISTRAAVNAGRVFEHLLGAATKRYKSVFAKIYAST